MPRRLVHQGFGEIIGGQWPAHAHRSGHVTIRGTTPLPRRHVGQRDDTAHYFGNILRVVRELLHEYLPPTSKGFLPLSKIGIAYRGRIKCAILIPAQRIAVIEVNTEVLAVACCLQPTRGPPSLAG